jgi:hypothetical protein
MAGFFVAQVKGFAARIADRVVVPGRQAEFVGVFAPGVGDAAFRNTVPKPGLASTLTHGAGVT